MKYLELIKSKTTKSNKDLARAFGYNVRTFERYVQSGRYPTALEVCARTVWYDAFRTANADNIQRRLDEYLQMMIDLNDSEEEEEQ